MLLPLAAELVTLQVIDDARALVIALAARDAVRAIIVLRHMQRAGLIERAPSRRWRSATPVNAGLVYHRADDGSAFLPLGNNVTSTAFSRRNARNAAHNCRIQPTRRHESGHRDRHQVPAAADRELIGEHLGRAVFDRIGSCDLGKLFARGRAMHGSLIRLDPASILGCLRAPAPRLSRRLLLMAPFDTANAGRAMVLILHPAQVTCC